MKILVADKLSAEGIDLLKAREGVEVVVEQGLEEAELARAAADVDAILVRSSARVTAAVIEAAGRLKVIGRAGIGVDNIDVPAATARGVIVMNVPDANANTTAEHTLSLIFALARSIPAADRSVREGKWERSKFIGSELQDKVLGVLGGGNIGRRVATRARALGMEVIVSDPYLAADSLADLHLPVVPIEELAARADIITVHVPKLDSTRNLVDAGLIERMKDGVRIVNCARGGIVNEEALLAALQSGKVRGAALDVFGQEPPPADHPLFAMENVVLTPHLGASTSEAQTRASVDLCHQVLAYLEDGEVRNALNLPRIAPDLMAELSPWIELGRRLGTLLAGIIPGPCERLEVSFQGRLSATDCGPVTRSLVAGLLQPAFETPVNMVNALALAEARGIALEERKSDRIRDFASMLTGTASCGEQLVSVSGTLFGLRQPRIVKVDQFHLEAIPEGALLVIRNLDTPGVIGRVGSVLGEAGVNIRALHLAPPRSGGRRALALFNVDPELADETLDAIRALPDIESATLVRMEPAG